MNPDEIIQLMRTCSMAQIRAQMETMQKRDSIRDDADLQAIQRFYTAASKRKP